MIWIIMQFICEAVPNNHQLHLRPVSTARVDGWPVYITRQHRPCWRACGFHYPSWRPELMGDQFTLPVNTGRVDGRAVSTSRVDRPLWKPATRQLGPLTLVWKPCLNKTDDCWALFFVCNTLHRSAGWYCSVWIWYRLHWVIFIVCVVNCSAISCRNDVQIVLVNSVNSKFRWFSCLVWILVLILLCYM